MLILGGVGYGAGSNPLAGLPAARSAFAPAIFHKVFCSFISWAAQGGCSGGSHRKRTGCAASRSTDHQGVQSFSSILTFLGILRAAHLPQPIF